MKIKTLLSIVLFFTLLLSLKAQTTTIEVNNSTNPESKFDPKELIEKVLINNSCAGVSNIKSSVFGTPSDLKTKSYGYFKSNTGSSFPFKEGIVLSTGNASSIGGATTTDDLSSHTTGLNDTDLSTSLGETNLQDATFIEFDFIPKSDEISFRYLMASEEYQNSFPCSYADGFAFLLRKSGTTAYTNLAVIPDTTIPVSVTNIHAAIPGSCVAQNEEYFAGNNLGDTNFNGRTKVLIAKAKVTPNVSYHIKLVIADNTDNEFDTAVFLEKGSFNLGLSLGPDLLSSTKSSVCGTEKLLTSNIIADKYQWYKDDVIIPSATAKDYLANLGDGKYTCKVTYGSCSDQDDVVLEFSKSPTNNTAISPLLTCNSSLDIELDLTSKIPEILAGQSDTIFEVLFYEDSAYTTQITTPTKYKNTTANDVIYTRIRTKSAIKCFVDSSFNSIITKKPILGTPSNYEKCDDAISGTDTDGFFNNFILKSKDVEVLDKLDPAIYKVSYHTTLSGAQTDKNTDVIDKDIPYRNITINSQKIYVRVESKNNINCNDASKNFNLVINPLPVITDTITLEQCDTDSDLSTIINLTIAQKNISANHLNETFKYYTTQSDAINDTSEITNQTAHTVANGTTIWVRTISDKNCYRISKINIVVGYAADIAYSKQFNACDDFLDIDGNNNSSNDDTDGISNFDLSSIPNDVKALFPAGSRPNLKVLIFENIADRDVLKNPIVNLSEYRNKNIPAKTPQKLYIKIINKINNNCTGIGSFDILVNTLPNFKLDNTASVCLNNPKTKLEPTNPDDTYTYSWNLKGNPTILSTKDSFNVLKGGTYVLTATTKNGCTKSKEIVVNESINPTLNDNDIIVLDDTNNNGLDSYSIKIITENNNLGIGNYQFALIKDGSFIFTFQDQPIFKNITGGIYTVVVNDKNGCNPDATLDVAVIQYDKFFTPNGDGKNDTWKIKGVNSYFYPSANITIADRFGKIMAVIPIDRKGWDGTYKGKILSSNDYWFKIQLVDKNGKNYQHQGHFSLLRR